MFKYWILFLLVSGCFLETFAVDSFDGSMITTSSTISLSSSPTTTRHTSTTRETSTSDPETLLRGTYDGDYDSTSSARMNGTSTSMPISTWVVETLTTTLLPTNTQPCNLYVEFCTRPYSNITNVGTHNSPFVRKNNAAANQELDVKIQLEDGVRMLQGQTHMVNETLYYCHTSCDLLNAGTVEGYLSTVVDWIKKNPFEIVTILIGNGDYVDIGNYTLPFENSGLSEIAYVPPKRNIKIDQWPTLSELILTGKRAVVFMDYKADEGIVPYILDEFSYMWETPFSQTDTSFPCTVDRPPGQPKNDTEGKLYMANHNLNVEFSFAGQSILVPNTVDINQTNAVFGYGSLGLQANTCKDTWERYPTFLLVDFYDAGNGSVFEIAAKANNVSYVNTCCGKNDSPAFRIEIKFGFIFPTIVAILLILL